MLLGDGNGGKVLLGDGDGITVGRALKKLVKFVTLVGTGPV